MSRDHRKLRVFHDAHALVLSIYRHSRDFPKHEWFGIRMQMRRAAVSVPANIVEGNARHSEKDYCNFLHVALGSACELAYLVTLASELGYLTQEVAPPLRVHSERVVRQVQALASEMDRRVQQAVTRDRRPKP